MARDYASEYQARQTRARAQGYGSYHAKRYGSAGRSMGSGDLDPTSSRRRIHEAVATFDEEADDWEHHGFGSSRVEAARYSPARRQLVVSWVNEPKGPPYPPYVYDGVPPAIWTEFRNAGSAGQYVNYALNTYPYRPAPEALGTV